MKTWIRRSLFGTALLFACAGAAFTIAAGLGSAKLERRVEVAVTPVALRSDAAAVARGRYLFASRGCADCHGADGAGHVVIDDGKGMFVRSPDITSAGATRSYGEADWVRSIRHGVKPDGRPIVIMPSEEYARYTDADLASVVAYVRRLPPGRGVPAELRLPGIVKALYALGQMKDASEKIDHRLPPPQPVPEGVTAAHGAYVANGCTGCHGPALVGGTIPGAPPDWPAAARLRPGAGSVLPRYPTADSFVAMLRSGKRPDGNAVSRVMPFDSLRQMSDVDVRALYLHLKALPEHG